MEFRSHEELVRKAAEKKDVLYFAVLGKDYDYLEDKQITTANDEFLKENSVKIGNSDCYQEYVEQQKEQYEIYVYGKSENERLKILRNIVDSKLLVDIMAFETSIECREEIIRKLEDKGELYALLLKEKNTRLQKSIFEKIKYNLSEEQYFELFFSKDHQELKRRIYGSYRGDVINFLNVINNEKEQLEYLGYIGEMHNLSRVVLKDYTMKVRLAAVFKIHESSYIREIMNEIDLDKDEEIYDKLLEKGEVAGNFAISFVHKNEEKYEKQCEKMLYYVANKKALEEIKEKSSSLYIRILASLILEKNIGDAFYR